MREHIRKSPDLTFIRSGLTSIAGPNSVQEVHGNGSNSLEAVTGDALLETLGSDEDVGTFVENYGYCFGEVAFKPGQGDKPLIVSKLINWHLFVYLILYSKKRLGNWDQVLKTFKVLGGAVDGNVHGIVDGKRPFFATPTSTAPLIPEEVLQEGRPTRVKRPPDRTTFDKFGAISSRNDALKISSDASAIGKSDKASAKVIHTAIEEQLAEDVEDVDDSVSETDFSIGSFSKEEMQSSLNN